LPPLIDSILWLTLPALLVFSAFFSGSETALFSLSGADRLRFKRDGHLIGQTVLTLLNETRELLITLLMGNMTVNVLYFVISTVLLIRLQREYHVHAALITILSVLPLLLVILLGEVLPKLVASRLPARWSRLCALPLMSVHRASGPFRLVTNVLIITPLARLIAPPQRPPGLEATDLEMLLNLSAKHGVIDPHEEDILQGVLDLSDDKVSTIMTPRVDVVAFHIRDEVSQLLKLIRETRLSYIVVYDGDIDHVVGLARSRDVLLHNVRTRKQLRAMMQEPRFVPLQQRIDKLLGHFRKTATTFAVVVDEYGGTAGIVTLEDAVEAMVGEIAGPYEGSEGHRIEQVGDGVWQVGAGLPIDDWIKAFERTGELDVPHSVSTLGGLVMTRLGRLPRVGDHVRIRNIDITVQSMAGRRVALLALRISDPTPAASRKDES